MCGISGFIDPKLSQEQAAGILAKSLQAMIHRGPDYTGTWQNAPVYLGHNRLSILDLDPHSHQPMLRDGLSLTFNGEIYNYIELREALKKEGYTFSTQSDTEVILRAYQAWGTQCVNRFLGMWAFAIWDAEKQTLFCSRDRFGIKPFYYIENSGRFYFASEVKGLKMSPVFSAELNLKQVARTQQLGWADYGTETYYDVISQVPAAHNLFWKNGKMSLEKYWQLGDEKPDYKSADERIEAFKNLFEDSINMHMRADVAVGACLSGGLDSSAIVSQVATNFPEIDFKTFTIFYEGKDAYDERPWVNKVLEKYPKIQNFSASPSADDLSDAFLQTLHFQDVPVDSSTFVSQYFVMQLAAKHGMKVLLDGQGSDEYLAGYFHALYRLVGNQYAKGNLIGGTKKILTHVKNQGFGMGKAASIAAKSVLATAMGEQKLYETEFKHYYPNAFNFSIEPPFNLNSHFENNKLNDFLYNLTFKTSLPTLLHYEDHNSMAFSIESRVPFLDHRLVELAFSAGDDEKIHNGATKYILRQALKPILPEATTNRLDKKGFVTPGETRWLRGNLSWLLEEPITAPFIDKQKAQKEIAKFKAGDNKNAKWLWRLVVLNYWSKTA